MIFLDRLTRPVPLLEQELPTLPEYMNSHTYFSEDSVTRSLVVCVVFCTSLFVLFLFAIVLFASLS